MPVLTGVIILVRAETKITKSDLNAAIFLNTRFLLHLYLLLW